MSVRPAWSKDQVPGQPEVHTVKPCHMAIRGPDLDSQHPHEDAHTASNYCHRDSDPSSHLRSHHECALTLNTQYKLSAEV